MTNLTDRKILADHSAGFSKFEDAFAVNPGSERTVLPATLADTMTVSLILNPESRLWLLHDRPFQDIVMWAEYDIDAASLSFILNGGKIQRLGMKIHPPVQKFLRHAKQLFTVQLRGQQTIDSYILPLLVRETGHHKI